MSIRAQNPLLKHRLVLIACLTMILIVAVYWQSFSRMVEMWSLSSYQHAWLVYPIALYILWRKRGVLAAARLEGSWAGVAFAAVVVLMWVLARIAGVQIAEFASATLLILATFWALAGTRAMQKAVFPLALLLAAVPTGEILVGYLMESAAYISTVLLSVAGVPVYREGRFLTLPGGSFEVAEVCGGLRYLLAGVLASLAFAYITYARFAKRALFVATVAATMVIANGVRAFIVMYVASATEMQVFAGQDHIIFGTFLFAAVFIGLIYIGERYADPVPVIEGPHFSALGEQESRLPVATTAAALLLIVAGPTLTYVQARQSVPAAVTAELPALPSCRGPEAWSGNWSPSFHGFDYQLRNSYVCGDYPFSVYVAGYLRQQQGKELISSSNRIWPHDWRRYVDEATARLDTNLGSFDVRQVSVQAPDRSMLIWYWYHIGDWVTASAIEVKLVTTMRTLTLNATESSVVVVQVEAPPETALLTMRNELEPKARILLSWYWNRLDQGYQ